MRTATLCLCLTALMAGWWLTLPQTAHAQWTNDPWNGMVPVATAPGNQEGPRICALSNGNTLIAWYDERTGVTQTYYQVLNSLGVPLLEINGLPLFEGGWTYGWGGPELDGLVPDGQGGCIAVVIDNRNGYWAIYGQRFDSLGNRLWGLTGLALVESPGAIPQDIVPDPAGNFFVLWGLVVDPNNVDQYVQKFNVNGDRLWGDYGQPVSTAALNQAYPQAVSDGVGGLIELWEDDRAGGYTLYLYAQHLDANGNPLLAVNGIPVLNNGSQMAVGGLQEGVTDGRGGGIWVFTTPGYTNNLKVVRVNGQGQLLWNWTSPYYAYHYINDVKRHSPYNTVWISASDNRPGAPGNYLYQFDIRGNPLFGPGGLPYGGYSMSQTSDGMMTFNWRQGAQGSRLYAQRVNSRGRLAWVANFAMSGIDDAFHYPVGASDGADGAVIAFEDRRQYANTQIDISAQRVQRNGQLGNPGGPQQMDSVEQPDLSILSGNHIQFTLPQAGQIKLELFDILGRMITTLQEGYQPAGMHSMKIDEPALPSGVYLIRLAGHFGQATQKVVILR